MSVVWQNCLSARFLDIVHIYGEVVGVNDYQTGRNKELLQIFADMLEFGVWHLRVRFGAVGSAEKVKAWINIWPLVKGANISLF